MAASVYPELSRRASGWLKFLWDKATAPDDWSYFGTPNPWWDNISNPPTELFGRFDLNRSTYSMGIMCDQTPAWREVYARICSELIERHTGYWASIDWSEQIGYDPRQADYNNPQYERFAHLYERFMPPHLRGQYDTAGWVAQGVPPWGLQPDPVGSTGNFFFRGFFGTMLSIYSYVSRDGRWEQPFNIAGYKNQQFEWTHSGIAQFTSDQWREFPWGPHCENTKVWPYCLAHGGLGLQLYDAAHGTDTHSVAQEWMGYCKKNYMSVASTGKLEWFALFYDPLINHVQTLPPMGGLAPAWFMLPQDRDLALYVYEAAMADSGWNDPRQPIPKHAPNDPRMITFALLHANEFGDVTGQERLREYAESHFGPRFFGDDDDRFGWWFGFDDEKYPRGQWNAMMMLSEVSKPDSWFNLFARPNFAKFDEPTVEGVDFPTFGLSQAWNDLKSGMLAVRTYGGPARLGETTTFSVTQLPDPAAVFVRCDGETFEQWEVTGPDSIRITTTIGTHRFQIYTGYHSGKPKPKEARQDKAPKPSKLIRQAKPAVVAPPVSGPSMPPPKQVMVPLSTGGCPCC